MRIVAFILFTGILAFGDSKAEQELRARLAAATAQLEAAARDRAAMQASLDKLTADAVARSAASAAAATAARRDAAAARQRTDAIAASAQSTADVNAAAKSTSETNSIKEQIIDTRLDAERWRQIQLIAALGGFVGVFIPVLLSLIKLAGDAGVRKGEHSAARDKMALIQAEAHYAAVLAGANQSANKAQEKKIGQIQELIGMATGSAPPLPATDSSLLKFTVEVPEEHHLRLAAALSKLEQVKINLATLSGTAQNTDGSEMEFSVLNGTTIGVTVTANPNHWTLDQLRANVIVRITDLLADR